jgi:hypothetical protein
VRSLLPLEPAVALSAAAEQWLVGQRDAGRVVYQVSQGLSLLSLQHAPAMLGTLIVEYMEQMI